MLSHPLTLKSWVESWKKLNVYIEKWLSGGRSTWNEFFEQESADEAEQSFQGIHYYLCYVAIYIYEVQKEQCVHGG